MSSPILGISFGNTSSSIAYINPKNDVDVIANPDGERAIPSVLSYVGEDEYHGGQALQQLVRNPTNTIVNFRDFIGLAFADADVSRCAAGAPAIEVDGKVGFAIKRGEDIVENITVDEVVTRHLNRLKLAAEDYIGQTISKTVLTVPTDFTDAQKDALSAAASKCGLRILQFISEPSASLLAHVHSFPFKKDANVVVADFGGVRSDAAVIAIRNGIFTVLATAHDAKLGGDNLDEALIEYFAADFQKKNQCNPRKNARSLAKLRTNAIITKKTLSNATTATISVESLADGFDYHTSINRMRYELTAGKVFSQFSQFINETIEKAKMDILDIDAVLLCGGVSFTPKLANNLEFLFPESVEILGPQNKDASNTPNELSCSGAALQGRLIGDYDADELKEALQPVVLNIMHLQKAIGLLDAEGKFVPVILPETTYPAQKTITIKKAKGDFLVGVYEGESYIEEKTLEPEAKPEADEEDSEEWSDDEPEVVREKLYKPATKLMELGIKDVTKGLQIIFNINKDAVLKVTARDLKSNAVVQGQL
ncbi:similar to Saccharomyces cerevisiae YHR064C SSZ1 Hsp70 protein that interacts with Zuo1p (a DnaJ homolog) to form a ribosome-associated complex that binds the ribosome via the Zuo1p subunit [Maudiozyma barnettii]|uniref:Similar to Saccharomyces cerevisiae YHR064C SSZ1 Hsp70 protein that interacts with Zuo1p (A DnaJ homolog) to form a ribosome-associated complex that binds the ribosome via the Zuo1p subunit n=1 Tax=Maudiozyma barnettii TaxID=61262 RepID=A0A8H2VBS0_9SACH|nr:Ssz1p [Kazachstania barnettii]CAB4252367.1 similar to Saccharomyces cerevisiae YHR064C SSZ1 Hsp70 protein that interacts with Zuo1p (a DnaJ homolog) to form a ribosome-associated complex that binds the ribosome via the Zuo1p subunit [Kazachstania barnettii]CAD1779101.1 similar to Saccharomyces cerevisiae YHR064C SSZ1 Hsp70 protein that interacts with Zuo1p (a DnaJ homolog) to form a ribosome-associated complex that binds the ribosome via the Zuo1p subunit [Kazachstania barnettii]